MNRSSSELTPEASPIWLPGRPVPFTRTDSAGRSGRRYTAPKYRGWLNAAAWEIRAQAGDRLDGPVAVSVLVCPNGIGVGLSPLTERVRPVGIRGDLDNYGKAVLDALQKGHAIGDDRQVEAIRFAFHPASAGPQ